MAPRETLLKIISYAETQTDELSTEESSCSHTACQAPWEAGTALCWSPGQHVQHQLALMSCAVWLACSLYASWLSPDALPRVVELFDWSWRSAGQHHWALLVSSACTCHCTLVD